MSNRRTCERAARQNVHYECCRCFELRLYT